MAELWEKINYSANITYLMNTYIYEVDIQKSNINVLRSLDLIDQATYERLCNAPRMVRQCFIGNLQKDVSINMALQAGVAEARRLLITSNQIQDNEILSIKNDALFIISRLPQIRDFGLIHFILKNIYTGFYKLNQLECFYYLDAPNRVEKLDIKGINDDKLMLHQHGFYEFLRDLFSLVQTNSVEVALRVLRDYYRMFIKRELPFDHYRDFDADSDFKYRIRTSIGTSFVIEGTNEAQKQWLDVTCNLKLLQELSNILHHAYFNQFRR